MTYLITDEMTIFAEFIGLLHDQMVEFGSVVEQFGMKAACWGWAAASDGRKITSEQDPGEELVQDGE